MIEMATETAEKARQQEVQQVQEEQEDVVLVEKLTRRQ